MGEKDETRKYEMSTFTINSALFDLTGLDGTLNWLFINELETRSLMEEVADVDTFGPLAFSGHNEDEKDKLITSLWASVILSFSAKFDVNSFFCKSTSCLVLVWYLKRKRIRISDHQV